MKRNTISSGEWFTRRALPAFVLLGSLSLGACTGDSGSNEKAINPDTTIESSEQPSQHEVLNEKVQATATSLATAIIDRYNSGGKDQYTQATRVESDPSFFSVQVKVDTNLVVGEGDYGQYTLITKVQKDKNGNFDPSTAKFAFVAMDIRNKDVEDSVSGEFYGFEITKASGADEWRVVSNATYKGPEHSHEFYVTEDPGNNPNIESLNMEALDRLTAQAQTVLDWSSKGTPISYAPAQHA